MDATPEPVRRPSDGELVGFVSPRADEGWVAAAVFGAPLATFDSRDGATRFLVESGLAVLAQPWWLWSDEQDRWRRAFLVEAGPGWVQVRCGHDPRSRDIRVLRGEDVALLRR